ncbi:MAG: dTMP kinase [Hyphomicrobiaceae bacterium]|nr:dTMP kinase [Hyphomicrobiaceae bacterium]
MNALSPSPLLPDERPEPPRRGRFITFEGGEGAGKTTQIRRLADRLAALGIAATVTREPGGSPRAEAIREYLLSGKAEPLGTDAEAILFAAARADHVKATIRPAIEAGRWVLCDRFIDSTRVYQGQAGVALELVNALERVAIDGQRPDLTLILDIPAEAGLARADARRGTAGPADRFERESLKVHRRRREAFLSIAMDDTERCVVIDADRPPDAVADSIWQAVAARFVGAGERQGGG